MSYVEILRRNTNVPQINQVDNYTLVKSDTHKSCQIKETKDQKANKPISRLENNRTIAYRHKYSVNKSDTNT